MSPARKVWRALLRDFELMPQHQDFGFKTSSRLERGAQHADEKQGNVLIRPQSRI